MWRCVCVVIAILVVLAASAEAGNVVEVRVTDYDGAAKGCVVYSRWDEKAKEFSPLHSRALKKGRDRMGLAPGTYRVGVVYTESFPRQEQTGEAFTLADGELKKIEFYFEKGVIKVSARDNDWFERADTRFFIYEWNEAIEEYVLMKSEALPTLKKRRYIVLAPGKYKVRTQYVETKPEIEWTETEFELEDAEVIPIVSLFGHGPGLVRGEKALQEKSSSDGDAEETQPSTQESS